MKAIRCFGILALPLVLICLLYELQQSLPVLRYIHPLARYVFLAAVVVYFINVARNYGWMEGGKRSFGLQSMGGRCLSAAAIAAIFALCFLALVISWSNGGTQDYSAIGGLLPYSDARDYFDGAERLLHDGTLTAFNERRPFNAAFLAARLWITRDNFYYAMILQAAVAATALSLACLTISKLYGRSIAFVFFAISFAFLDGCLHRTLSEPLGISLGLIALALYFSSIAETNLTRYAFATFMLTLALLTRAGAMFALPSSALFAMFFFAENWKRRAYALSATIAAIAAGWFVSFLLVRIYGTGGVLLSNFSYTIYGLSQGGRGWTQAITDFPRLTGDDAQVASFLYHKAFESILSNPLLLIVGLARTLSRSLIHFPFHLLGLLADASDGSSPSNALQRVLVALLLVPVLICGSLRLAMRRPIALDRFEMFLLFQLFGFIASLPFFYDDGGIRLTAATFPFSAATIAVILAASASLPKSRKAANFRLETGVAGILGLSFIVVSLLAPKVARIPEPASVALPVCAKDEINLRIEIGDGTAHINILDGNAESRLPNIRRADFVVSEINENKQFWDTMALPATVWLGFDYNSNASPFVVGPPGFASGPRRLVAICATPLNNGVVLYRGPGVANPPPP